jgi:hypothetical protein
MVVKFGYVIMSQQEMWLDKNLIKRNNFKTYRLKQSLYINLQIKV